MGSRGNAGSSRNSPKGIHLIYTVGYGRLRAVEFANVLKNHAIELVVDVRRFPTSKFWWFRKEHLKKILERRGIAYVHLAGLGGFRGGYEKYMRSDEFKWSLSELERMAKRKTAALMCVEESPSACHRRFIARTLEGRGWKVVHLSPREAKG